MRCLAHLLTACMVHGRQWFDVYRDTQPWEEYAVYVVWHLASGPFDLYIIEQNMLILVQL